MDHQTQGATDTGMMSVLLEMVMACCKSSIQRRQAWALNCVAKRPWLLTQLIRQVHSRVLEPLDNLLTVQDSKIVTIILDTR